MRATPEMATSRLMNSDLQSPVNVRMASRTGSWRVATTGLASGFLQANLAVLPRSLADDFAKFCALNYGPLPLLYKSAPGETGAPLLAGDSDVRTDLPMYQVFVDGTLQATPSNLLEYPWEDMVSFYFGCSFSFEQALSRAGVGVRNVEKKKNFAAFITNINLVPVGRFGGKMVVTMRPIKVVDLPLAVKVTMQTPSAHGAPIHIGDPWRIGITDISNPDFGDSITIREGEVPVFWACGITTSTALQYAAPELCFTHKPGCMYVSDIPLQEWEKDTPAIPLEVIPVTATFYSCLGASVAGQVAAVQEVISPSAPTLDGDLLKSILALSHTVGATVLVALMDSVPENLISAIALTIVLRALGTGVHFICSDGEWTILERCIDYCVAEGILSCNSNKPTHSSASTGRTPHSDCLVMFGAEADGTTTEIIQRLRNNTSLSIALVSAGEGMVGCLSSSATTLKVAAGSVAEGGWALAAGLCAVTQCPVHWWYRNHALGEKSPPKCTLEAFLPTDNQVFLLNFVSKLSSGTDNGEQLPKFTWKDFIR